MDASTPLNQSPAQTGRGSMVEMLCGTPHRGANPCELLNFALDDGTLIQLDGVFRGYYRTDQRIQWSGVEETFGAEGILRPLIQTNHCGWVVSAEAEFFINQPYGSSILRDAERDLYRANFDVDPFEIFQLFCQAQRGDFRVRLGRTRTPFGSYLSPMFSNSLIDAPFIRTDVISWTETGIFAHYSPSWWSVDVGIINGENNLDTNSDKGFIGRVGIDQEIWSIGISGKSHDGISSEQQKRYNNHAGIDFAIKFGRMILYGEAIYDEYGFHRDFFGMNGNGANLGVRSFYGRDVFKADKTPVKGYGHYVALGYRGDRVFFDASIGSYSPETLGIATHDEDITRFVGKTTYSLTDNLQLYGAVIVENHRLRAGVLNAYHPYAVLTGMQFIF